MPYGMYVSAAGAEAQSRYLEVLSNNLANADTAGFRRDFAVVQARHSEAIERGEVSPGSGSINDVGGGVAMNETVTDFSPGKVKQTKIPTDLLIDDADGHTFFVVEKDGKPMLTRAGDFRFSTNGELQTQDGLPVLSQDGQHVRKDPSLTYFRFSEDGALEQDGLRVPLALVRPQSLGDLVKAGQNLFLPLANPVPAAPEQRRVKEGALELSSAKPTELMMDLIKATRAYEANIRMIQNHDQMIGSLVNRVLKQA